LDRLFDSRQGQWSGPITGDGFAPWSDGLREVEELIDVPTLRNDVARAREHARQMRQDYRRNQKKPDWATVRLQVLKPLVEVSNQINEDLARREPGENLVPIDRDPVPGRYSELVRRYYEQLGKGGGTRDNPPTKPQN
jgi:energy-converting hydrogenase A subunit M